ncbi:MULTISPECIES: hypothetical protein [unclassified Enterococcus]|uniref:hypothetical protein n=1 Tax=unclassified Enterococcus TaxID=2608891 RepID=UPI003F1F6227
MVKRTKKSFLDYNEYRDRPFGLKWSTAFAMDELMKGVKENEAWATKEIAALELMNREEIDVILSESFLYHKPVSIQLNSKDEFGRFLEPVEGYFLGEAYEDYFVISDRQIFWPDVRHIKIKAFEKWSTIDYFDNKPSMIIYQESSEVVAITNEFFQPFLDDDSE